ncbi:MHS family MFS transporter (plasmid) [Agrobacterium salinitolerans]|uniref:MHS family MFS transporter n=1 Tax=Agrobacterium salinitolerans TaxID=1183413 RepID=A0A4Z1R1Q5_9HYPH|nr:MFS transporter [Agrobacterium salinitolerans]MDH6298069.1 MHS family shikimate/dehydroshikimate transporter-like MFS transporter [Agrobacterium fabrum]UYZ11111.1 MHS family MFS transporter [Agrobacterium salinitolerans]
MSYVSASSASGSAVHFDESVMRRVTFASIFGTALEAYDLYLFGTAAALIFAPLFFPAADPSVSILLSLTTFAISFVARPVGSIVLGHYGDRIGRKKLLFLTLVAMGLSTAAIGFLPTYASAGFVAPLLLCIFRFIQGFAYAGEYSGAVIMLLEHAPKEKRGFYAGLNNIGPVFGFIMSSGFFLGMSALMDDGDFLAWGWRIPFLASLLLLAVGIYVRARVPESPVFEKAKADGFKQTGKRLPISALFKEHTKVLLLACGANTCHFATFYIFTVFSLSYATKTLGLPRAEILFISMLAVATHLIAIPYAAARSDRIGRKKALIQGFLFIAVSIYPFWYLFNTASFFPMLLGSSLLMVAYSAVYGVIPSFTSELFPAEVRFSGSAIAYNIGGILGGGFAPLIAATLVAHFGSVYPTALLIAGLAMMSLVSVVFLPNTNARDLHD